MLLKADEEVKTQIDGLTKKKSEQIEQFAQNICTNAQVEEIDKKVATVMKREDEKKKELSQIQDELNELEKNTENDMNQTKEKVILLCFYRCIKKIRSIKSKLSLKQYRNKYKMKCSLRRQQEI